MHDTPNKLPVYNLEFGSRSTRIDVAGYVFERVEDYVEKQSLLQNLVNSFGSEFPTQVQTGGHAHTANVSVPTESSPSIIWQHDQTSALNDIVLLLSLFTGRDVFFFTRPIEEIEKPFALLADSRIFPWGGVLSCSLTYEFEETESPYQHKDITLETYIPKIFAIIQSDDWKRRFKNGYFLVLAKQAFQQHGLEAAFVLCWTIWEHLFACLTDDWMSSRGNMQLSAKEKIAFLLIHFAIRDNLQESQKSRLDDLVSIRNRLIHFGKLPAGNSVTADALMFIRMTEFVIAKALGLFPSNVFNTIENLEKFLNNAPNRGSHKS